ncbi:lipoate--protein ligase family protein [Rhodopirellula sallentina]|uniref:Biotin/lipoate A/B protein ligase n=1 Tax=Rhodopirellula sallentina SM41 TaxID=1263870 RepID=M5U1T1_9BACT|nr:biotin/lipoate A/B protein ligase family protein [Rhodopirellula sallentina]EMI55395.1 biotin/lipoate A/B protein ligase [Rhodopirellula sallentina SM41]
MTRQDNNLPSQGRLLPFALHDAASNMAIDEAIVQSVAKHDVAPTLRFYGWSRPTLSLGYFQTLADAEVWSGQDADRKYVDIVRRSTGGGAILHHFELTYSLSLPLSDTGPGARECVYQGVHRSVVESLAKCGVASAAFRETASLVEPADSAPEAAEKQEPDDRSTRAGLRSAGNEPFLCFERRTDEDLICGGYKILGSAQRRVRGGVLQHGSLLLRVSPHAPSLPGVLELSGAAMPPRAIAELIAAKVGEVMGMQWQAGEITDAEQDAAEQIRASRYAAAEWTGRR